MSTTHMTSTTLDITGPSLAAVEQHIEELFELVPGECDLSIDDVMAPGQAGEPVTVTVTVLRDPRFYDDPSTWTWSAIVHPA